MSPGMPAGERSTPKPTCAARPLARPIRLLEQLSRLALRGQLQRPLVQLRLEGQVGIAQALQVRGVMQHKAK